MAKDYYKILGVSKDASQDEIKRAYRRKARQYHPDVNPGDKASEERFKEINEAYEVLGNSEKRRQYDQFGTIPDFGTGFRDFRGFGTTNFEDIFSSFGFDDLFDVFSRRERTWHEEEQGADLRYDLTITLEEAYSGIKKDIEFQRFEECSACKGTGARNGTAFSSCYNCNGSGQSRNVRRTPFGQFVTISTCKQCKGKGKVIKEKCDKCNGVSRIRKTVKLEVKIPAGIDSGYHIRLRGQGEPGSHGMEPGDLYVIIHVEEHPIFERRNLDLLCDVKISMVDAALGSTIKVPTITGEAELKIPAGTQSHTIFKLRGAGMPDIRSSRKGDELVNVIVEIPKKLTAKQKQLLKEFTLAGQEKKGFFSSLYDRL
jgi:molecular chaperone DnaJ